MTPSHDPTAPATKADIQNLWKRLEGTFATKDDLKRELSIYVTKEDLDAAKMELAELFDTAISAQSDDVESRFEFIAEHYFHEISGANKDEKEMMKDKLQNHERRIQVLEVK